MLTVTASRPAAVTITLPLPPSTNNLYANRGAGKGRRPTEHYEAWLTAAGWHCVVARAKGRIPYRFHLLLTLPEGQRADINNRDKALLDLLKKQGIIAGDQPTYFRRYAVVVSAEQQPGHCTVELWNTDEAPAAKGRGA